MCNGLTALHPVQILDMAKEQHGCRYLQRLLGAAAPSEVQLLLDEVLPHIGTLMVDPFGNYLVQKVLDVCTEAQRLAVLERACAAPGGLPEITRNTHGTRAAQKLVESVRHACRSSSSSHHAYFHALPSGGLVDCSRSEVPQTLYVLCLLCPYDVAQMFHARRVTFGSIPARRSVAAPIAVVGMGRRLWLRLHMGYTICMPADRDSGGGGDVHCAAAATVPAADFGRQQQPRGAAVPAEV